MSTQGILETLTARGFVAQTTDAQGSTARLAQGPQHIYTGYDPTGDSLHVGHLVTLMALRHFELAGHKPIVILGGGTAHVGDPSGKSEMRPVLTRAHIDANAEALTGQIGRILGVEAGHSIVLNNADWLLKLNYIEFLRDVGRHFSVNRMLSFDAYKQRLERGLSFIEFNYQLLQAYDFYVLAKQYDCAFQLGGDDQWGNIVAGVDLCRRMASKKVDGITVPLLTSASGAKMGKTAAGAIWLDAKKLSPYDYYQYWVNTEDADVARFLRIFTFLPLEQIQSVEHLSGAELNACKSILAFEATSVVHTLQTATQVHIAAQSAFGARPLPAHLLPHSQVPRQVALDAAQLPSYTLSSEDKAAELTWASLLVTLGAAKSKGEATRLIDQGGLRIDDVRVGDARGVVAQSLLEQASVTLKVGKKRVFRLHRG